MYEFSGCADFYYGQYMFHRFYAFLPLLLMEVELFRRNKRKVPLILSTSLSVITCYYLMFPTFCFLALYYPFTLYYHSQEIKLKSLLELAVVFTVGVLLTFFLMVPCIFFILGNDRVLDNHGFRLWFEHLEVYNSFLLYFLAPSFSILSNRIPILYTLDWTDAGHLSAYSMYTGILSIPSLFSLRKLKNISHEYKALWLLEMTLLICLFVPFLNSVFHGFSVPSFRWTFLFAPLNLLVMAVVFSKFRENRIALLQGSRDYLILLAVCFLIGSFTYYDYREKIKYWLIIAGCLTIFVSYFILIRQGKLKCLLLLSCLECFAFSSFYLWDYASNHGFFNDTLDEKEIQYLQETDSSHFFRIYTNPRNILPFLENWNKNNSALMNYKSVATYDSTYEVSLRDFLDWVDCVQPMFLTAMNWNIEITDPESQRMLGVKYYYVLDETELPSGYTWTYVENNNLHKIYRLEENRPIGFTYSSFIAASEVSKSVKEKKKLPDGFQWNEVLATEPDLNEFIQLVPKVESVDFTVTDFYDDNNIIGTITVDSPQVLFLSIPYSKGWTVYDNEVKVKTNKVQGGFIGIPLEPGSHQIRLNFMPQGLKIGVMLSGLGICALAIAIAMDKKKINTGKK